MRKRICKHCGHVFNKNENYVYLLTGTKVTVCPMCEEEQEYDGERILKKGVNYETGKL